jgi:transcriptional regulator with XRE-family HTH domain
MTELYQRVREARKLLSISQEELAADLGVSRSAVAQWEMTRGTAPSVENLIALARRSGMTFEYLSTGRGHKVHGKPILAIAEEPTEYQNLSRQQQRLLALFDVLSAKQRSGLLEFLESLSAAGARHPKL